MTNQKSDTARGEHQQSADNQLLDVPVLVHRRQGSVEFAAFRLKLLMRPMPFLRTSQQVAFHQFCHSSDFGQLRAQCFHGFSSLSCLRTLRLLQGLQLCFGRFLEAFHKTNDVLPVLAECSLLDFP